MPPSSPVLDGLAEDVRRILADVDALEATSAALPLPAFRESEWYAALSRKLSPQLERPPTLIVAVVGGTNIGKSVVFNHIAGQQISASSSLASKTKHPTCIAAPRWGDARDLEPLFAGFQLRSAVDPQAPFREDATDLLFHCTLETLPDNLLLLDTPDVDSDASMNWRRADAVRHAADVLVAVLTDQNYNDAAVKRFFRAAAEEDKPVVLVFNLMELPEDEQHWPNWCGTFQRETGVTPLAVFVAPRDPQAVTTLTLPFYERSWPAESSDTPSEPATKAVPLGEVFSRLRFEEIKLRTLRGAVARVVDRLDGLPAFLEGIRQRSRQHNEAVQTLAAENLVRDDRWPLPPTALFVTEIRRWWGTHREGVSKWIHDGYGWLGRTVWTPVQRVFSGGGGTEDPWEAYLAAERAHALALLERLIERLSRLASVGNEVLRPRLESILSGESREQALAGLENALQSADPARDLEAIVEAHLTRWREEQPALFGLLRQADRAAAFARPALTVTLVVAGAGPVGGAMLGALPDLLAQSLAVHVAGETLAAAGTVAAGETTANLAARGIRQMELWFSRLQAAFLQRRSALLAAELDRLLVGGLLNELRQLAEVSESPAFRDLETRAANLERAAGRPG